ncbi:MAG TPA: hypothetical protein DCK95_05690 [Anaerolineaceae bacterium]|nr:hypothetical protein [Anaerolineaceae bacterium]
MEIFKVSVIIPVYNAASFVTQAVESALAQPETAEVILIEIFLFNENVNPFCVKFGFLK